MMGDQTMTHADLVTVTAFLAAQGCSAGTIAHVVEKPWCYEAELALATAVDAHDDGRHHPYPDGEVWRCCFDYSGLDPDGPGCNWTHEASPSV